MSSSGKRNHDRIESVLTEALGAVTPKGEPDHATRLRAAELLLRSTSAPSAEPESATIIVTQAADGTISVPIE